MEDKKIGFIGAGNMAGALIKADMEKWGDIGRRLGVKLD